MSRKVPRRYCSECGRRMRRIMGLINRQEWDTRTGKRAWVWYYGCPEGFRGYCLLYLDGRQYHDADRVPASKVRQRIAARNPR